MPLPMHATGGNMRSRQNPRVLPAMDPCAERDSAEIAEGNFSQ
jgi:hypothetical protein